MAKKKHKHDEHMDESWLIPYADILTLLLALFIVLFAMSQIDQEKFNAFKQSFDSIFTGSTGVMVSDRGFTEISTNPDQALSAQYLAEEHNLHEIKEMLDQYFEEQGYEAQITTLVTEKGLLITIQDIALFDSGKANLRPEFLGALNTIAEILSQLDNSIEISGHTDNLPINTSEFPSNWDLSVSRALNVVKYMLNNPQLYPERLSVVGYGEYKPIATNSTSEGRASNRRVELLVQRIYSR